MNGFWQTFIQPIPSALLMVLKAVLILVLAIVFSVIGKALVTKIVSKALGKSKVSDENKKELLDFLSKFVFLFIFLLFVPSIFGVLGIDSVAQPINTILMTVWGYIPKIIAAGIVLVIGLLIAKLVRELLIPVFGKCRLDVLQEKAGIKVKDSAKLSNTLAYIVYVLIVIPVIITAINVLGIDTIAGPANGVLAQVIAFIPNLAIGVLIIVIGVFLSGLVAQIVERIFAATGWDEKLSALLENNKIVLSKIAGMVVRVLIVVFFVVEGLNALHLAILGQIGAAVIGYLPAVLGTVLILVATLIISGIIEKLLRKSGSVVYATIAKYAIITIGAFMMLNQLGIATQIVNAAFIIILGALALSFIISFGIGGRTFASHMLQRLENKLEPNGERKEEKEEKEVKEVKK